MAFTVQLKFTHGQVGLGFSASNGASSAPGKSRIFWELYRTTPILSSVVQSPAGADYLVAHVQDLPKLNTAFFRSVFFRSVQLEETLSPSSVAWEIPFSGAKALIFKGHSLFFW